MRKKSKRILAINNRPFSVYKCKIILMVNKKFVYYKTNLNRNQPSVSANWQTAPFF